jgi:hypothetical protein
VVWVFGSLERWTPVLARRDAHRERSVNAILIGEGWTAYLGMFAQILSAASFLGVGFVMASPSRPATLPASAGLQVKTGVIGWLAEGAAQATGGDPLTATMLILFLSALLSGIVKWIHVG